MSYTPGVLVEDITKLTNDEWLAMRKHGIGGSDAAKIFGDSKWATARELFWDKTGQKNKMPKNQEDNWIGKEVGHRLEELVIQVFMTKNPGWQPYAIRKMFYHPDYPWMLADCDAFVKDPRTGKTYILEIKTTSVNALDKWGERNSNVVPRDYEWQGRHYMAVTGCDGVIYAALAGNTEDGYRQRFIARDLSIEEELIEGESDFWNNYVLPGIEPPFVESSEQALNAIKEHFWKQDGVVDLSYSDFGKSMSDYLQLKEERAKLEKEVRALKKKEEAALLPILEELKGKDGKMTVGKDVYTIEQKITKRKYVPTSNLNMLQLSFPEAYEQFVQESESLKTTVKKKRGV